MSNELRLLEALLFASAEPMSPAAMRERLPENADLGGLLAQLRKVYDGRGVALVEIGGSWAFRTAADLGDALKLEKQVQRKMSRAALETLAIIAYHQPVTRAEIENIRGVATSKGTIDVLMETGWIRPGRRREAPGRPLTWITTTAFLDHFGLESMMDLPGLDELKASGLLDRRPAIEVGPQSGDLFERMVAQDGAQPEPEEDDGEELFDESSYRAEDDPQEEEA